jgi:hypothetical protein
MMAATLIRLSLTALPLVPVPQPAGDCRLEVLTPQGLEARTVAEFDARVDAYLTLHRRIARAITTTRIVDDEEPFFQEELRAALLAARPQAQQGGFFTPAVADVIRDRIRRSFASVRNELPVPLYEPLAGEAGPAVNRPFPLVTGPLTWPALGSALPPVPGELEYAFWGTDLALVDTVADLVIDILPDALPPGARPGISDR